MDVTKLKVVELRQELQARGLDTKGVKAVLAARLIEALEAESGDGNENGTGCAGAFVYFIWRQLESFSA